MLSLSVIKGFSETSVAKLSRNYGTLTFKFSVQCQARCELILVSEVNRIESESNPVSNSMFVSRRFTMMNVMIGLLSINGILTRRRFIRRSLNTREFDRRRMMESFMNWFYR